MLLFPCLSPLGLGYSENRIPNALFTRVGWSAVRFIPGGGGASLLKRLQGGQDGPQRCLAVRLQAAEVAGARAGPGGGGAVGLWEPAIVTWLGGVFTA